MFLAGSLLLLVAASPAGAQTPDAQAPTAGTAHSTVDVNQLFATTCGWCHAEGGRAAGRGPQLMNTTRTDTFIRYRIRHGKEGAMPAFPNLSDADLDAIVSYIRDLKPEAK